MRRAFLAVVASWGILGAFPAMADDYLNSLRAERARKDAQVYQMMTNRGGGQTYSPQYGYSTGYAGRGNMNGNGGPFMGRGHFAPGYGYGSIYGNSGHPGFGRYTGPAWGHPAAWGYGR